MKSTFTGRGSLAWAALMAISGCATPGSESAPAAAPVVEVVEDPEWRSIATPGDLDRIERLDEAWSTALAEAQEAGFRRAIAAEGELLDPDAGLPRPAPTPGPYRCRVIKIGTQGKVTVSYIAYKPFFCYVEAEGDLLTIVKQTGSQRPAGRLYPDGEADRLVFLGSLALGNEEAPLAYREDPERDMVGIMERVAPFRFRLVIPWPRYESKLDVIELVPATG